MQEDEIPDIKDFRVRAEAKLLFARMHEKDRPASRPPSAPRMDLVQVRRGVMFDSYGVSGGLRHSYSI